MAYAQGCAPVLQAPHALLRLRCEFQGCCVSVVQLELEQQIAEREAARQAAKAAAAAREAAEDAARAAAPPPWDPAAKANRCVCHTGVSYDHMQCLQQRLNQHLHMCRASGGSVQEERAFSYHGKIAMRMALL
jgi:hypothetical protein